MNKSWKDFRLYFAANFRRGTGLLFQ